MNEEGFVDRQTCVNVFTLLVRQRTEEHLHPLFANTYLRLTNQHAIIV